MTDTDTIIVIDYKDDRNPYFDAPISPIGYFTCKILDDETIQGTSNYRVYWSDLQNYSGQGYGFGAVWFRLTKEKQCNLLAQYINHKILLNN